MLDSDLARLYQVETFNLNKAVKRNLNRFPEDFMFQLSQEEAQSLRFQIGMSHCQHLQDHQEPDVAPAAAETPTDWIPRRHRHQGVNA
jgi:hypothetical protein